MKKVHKSISIGFFVGLFVWGISTVFFNSHPGKVIELKGLDYLFYLRGSVSSPQNIIIAGIDDASFNELKLSWPWPREIHAKLINALQESGAKAIVYDILFADPASTEGDASLAKSIKTAGNVILPSEISFIEEHGYKQVSELKPLQIFQDAAAGVGASALVYDYDNVIRRGRLKFGKIKSLTYESLRVYGIDTQALLSKLNKDILINFTGPSRNIKTVSFYQALNHESCLPSDIFKNKIVLVGRSLTASPEPQAKYPDIFPTPHFPDSKIQMAGVEIVANFIHTVLNEKYIVEPLKPYISLALLLILVLLAIIEIRINYITSLFLTIVCSVFFGLVSCFFFSHYNILLPIFMPATGIFLVFASSSLTRYFTLEQEKNYIKNAFQKYVPPSVVKKILEAPDKLRLGGEEITGTVLFSDLEKFTTVSEKFEPEKLVSFINEYLSEMSEIIFKNNGTITRFIGDAILAIWGAPVRQDGHAERAVKCAMEMAHRLLELNIEWKYKGLPELKIRIGVNTGKMVVGNVGSKKHMDYTAMGDSVNLASRLEDINKVYSTSIIIGHATYELVNKIIECRRIDVVTVKGRGEPVEIYEPIKIL
jgi:adenylate cyclase